MEQFNKDGSSEFSDEAVRSFLLGRLTAEEQSKFEERLFTDEKLEDRVRLAECELADEYAFARLISEERQLFQKKFLVSTDRKQKLRVSNALREHFASAAEVTARSELRTRERFLPSPGFNQPPLRFAIGVATLILLVGIVWLVFKEPRISRQFMSRRPLYPIEKTESAHARDASPMPTHQTTASPMPVHEPSSPVPTPKTGSTPAEAGSPLVIMRFVLDPHTPRDSGQMSRFNLPKSDGDIVRLQLTLETDQPGTYRAALLTAEGQSVFSAESLKPADTGTTAKIDFDVPARLLKTGDYRVKLRGVTGGIERYEARYYFRVQ